MRRSKKIAIIKPKNYAAGSIRKQLYDAVDCVANSKSPAIAYAFVSFHKDKTFRAYWETNNTDINPIDLPDMVRARLMAKSIKNMSDN